MSDEALRRSDELLSELIETVETARAVPMSTSCVLPRERLLDLLDELREVLPPEMDRARTLIASRDRVIREAREHAAQSRERSVAEADAVLADARHQADQIVADSENRAAHTVEAGKIEHARLVASTTVHQAAAQASAALRADAEAYQAQVSAEAQQYDAKIRSAADRHAHDARADAERYAVKLTADAEDYAERTLADLAATLQRAAQTADQGRGAIAARRAEAWAADGRRDGPYDGITRPDDGDPGKGVDDGGGVFDGQRLSA